MTRWRFSRWLALRGPDLARWPASERGAALRLLRRSAAARRRYLAALDDDAGIDAEAAVLDPALTARLMAGARRGIADEAHRSRRARRVPLPVPAMRWGALAACAVVPEVGAGPDQRAGDDEGPVAVPVGQGAEPAATTAATSAPGTSARPACSTL